MSRRPRASTAPLLAGLLLIATGLVMLPAALRVESAPAATLDPVNPVRATVDGHPANSGFLVFVEGDVTLRNDESEGTMALGGDLRIQSNYHVAAGAEPVFGTYTAPGDDRPTYLHVGGGISWEEPNSRVYVENRGFTKIGRDSSYTAHERDNNNAQVNYRIVRNGSDYNTIPHIDGRTRQSPASIGVPVPDSLIDIGAAFSRYRVITDQLADCPANVDLVNDSGALLPRPIPAGSRGRLSLVSGRTNVLTLSETDLANLAEITFLDRPTADTPLLVNVTGAEYLGNIPNMAGVSGGQAPYILWNFADATRIVVTGGDSIEGTLYAPNAALTWVPTQNIEGNVIAASFNHGMPEGRTTREIHDFPFDTELSCTTSDASPPSLTLVKEVVNDNGGTADVGDWTLSANGPTPVEGTSGDAEVTGVEVEPGDYLLAEDGPGGYDTDGWSCDGGVLSGNELTLAPGEEVTCTIVNDDQPGAPPPDPRLTLVKEVVNEDGGRAYDTDWELSADGPTTITGPTGAVDVTDVEVPPGDYQLSEDGPPGYDASDWSCDGGTLTGESLTLAPGEEVTCTIVNDDQPGAAPDPEAELTLVKRVVNDDGGTARPGDWTLAAEGPTAVSGPAGGPAVTARPVAPGEYQLSESGGPSDYDAGDWSCDGGTLTGATVVLEAGELVTCTIVNDDRAGDGPTEGPTDEPTDGPTDGPSEDPTDDPGADGSDGDGLPDTGGPAVGWLAFAVGLVGAGLGMVAFSVRRRTP
ncbi:choice-of-anchor A family protein [Nocardioides sp. BGMRC 2183]|nr:choice-of-anchor A family protein [Nocardioides sp. BGMRC 2183]